MEKIARILQVAQVTHDVKSFKLEKPQGYSFVPGQATEVSINKPEFRDQKNPFTFTSLNEDPFLEFVIKIYSDHDGVTKALDHLHPGDELIIRDVWGAIQYKGPGVFIAGGAGITPFIAILRQLFKDRELEGNQLIFSNKTEKDIILKEELEQKLGDNFINTITHEESDTYHTGLIDKEFLKEHVDNFKQHFYVCGPPAFIDAITAALKELGAKPDTVVIEN